MFNVREKSPVLVFSKSLVGIKYIQHIQNDLKRSNANKYGAKLRYLNQSYVFHLVALWQVFIEESAKDSFNGYIQSSQCGGLSDVLMEDFNTRIKRFNTPSVRNIDKLFYESLGLKNISSKWEWSGVTNEQAISRLSVLLKTRHKIAHTRTASGTIDYSSNFETMKFIYNIACIINNEIVDHLKKEVGHELYWGKQEIRWKKS